MISVRINFDDCTGVTSVKTYAGGTVFLDCEDKLAAELKTIGNGLKAICEIYKVDPMIVATIILNKMGCMTDEDAEEAFAQLCGKSVEEMKAAAMEDARNENAEEIKRMKAQMEELSKQIKELENAM